MGNQRILWADDEIDLLKPHIMFLRNKGYDVTTVNSGRDAVDMVAREPFDLIILDENMPGLSGLEALNLIKKSAPSTPVIMITKSEEEDIMNQAIGNKISDYLIKPVNPNQILLSIKKLLHSDSLVSRHTTDDYRREFGSISSLINDCRTIEDWYALYDKLVYWELELSSARTGMAEMLAMQKSEADREFAKFIKRHYGDWMSGKETRPLMSHDIMRQRVLPLVVAGEKVLLVVVDNLRLDQWRVVKHRLADIFNFREELYTSILPTSTQYARNAIFSGLVPAEIARLYPGLWIEEDDDDSKNRNEQQLLSLLLERLKRDVRFSYTKLNDSASGEKLTCELGNLSENALNVVVINFIDMLSHARTDSRMIRELASTDAAFRSLSESWFMHSATVDLLRKSAEKGFRVLLTTDHGTIRVDRPIKVMGDKGTSVNLRYKLGRHMSYNPKEVYEIKQPDRCGLPSPNISSTYIFATGDDFFVYPNNYNHYVQYYTGTFQHGGISMEEMIVPIVEMKLKGS